MTSVDRVLAAPVAAGATAGPARVDLEAVFRRIYVRGDRLTTRFVLSHMVLTLVLAPFYQTWTVSLVWGGLNVIAWLAAVLAAPGAFVTRATAGIVLESFCALHIWQMHGQPEQHFWFFVGFTMMIVYQDWRCMWPGTLLIIAQHSLFAGLHNQGFDLHFFPERSVDVVKLLFHFGIALVHVAVCGYWAWLLRRQTIRDYRQRTQLLDKQRKIESQLLVSRESESALRAMASELTRTHVELERDIAERQRAEAALRASEEGLRIALDAARMLSWSYDPATGALRCSDGADLWFGAEAGTVPTTLGEFLALIHEEDRDRVAAWFAGSSESGDRRAAAYRIRRASGEIRWVVLNGQLQNRTGRSSPRIVGVMSDVTDRKEEEEHHRQIELKMQHAQKLESLGVLAGGVAHDFNNLLVGILGNASLAGQDLPAGSPAAEPIADIEAAAQRAADLTRQMLAYSGQGKFVIESVSISGRVRQMAQLLGSIIAKKTELRLDLAADLAPIRADPTQLDQVIMNLVTNASESLDDQGGPVTVRTGVTTLDRDGLGAFSNGDAIAPGRYAFLEVVDQGVGMSPETVERIFDPFFTTKFTGRGLGLAAVLGILRGHGGAIRVETTLGRGSRFTVIFPVLATAPAQSVALPTAAVTSEGWRGSGLILVIDDEPGILRLAQRLLRRHGFDVATAEDGVSGLELFEARRDETTLVLLDRTMPGLSGEEVLAAMHRIRPDLPVLLSSGYTEQTDAQRAASASAAGFVAKPYLAADLVAAIRQALVASQPTPNG